MSEWFDQAGGNEDGNIMRGEAEVPSSFLYIQPRRRQSHHAQKLFPLSIHRSVRYR